MVEIWRWPKASLSASLTACMETPRRPAVSRSTSTMRAQAAVLRLGDDVAQCRRACAASRRSRGAQVATSAASLPTSVYWYCARLMRVLIWMSCTGWKYTVTPGTPAPPLLQPVDDRADRGLALRRAASA